MILKPPKFIRPIKGHPLTRVLAGYWLFNEGSGDKVFDLSGNGNDLTLVNAPDWVPGRYGSAVHFNDGSDKSQYGFAAAANGINLGTNSFSISWFVVYPLVKVSEDDYSGIITDINWNTSASNPNCWALCTGSSGQPSAIRYYDIEEVSSYANSRTLLTGIPDGLHHFVFVRDVQNMRFKLYQNGVKVYDSAFTSLTNLIANNLDISRSGGSADERYTGMLALNYSLHKRILSASEVTLLYREPFCMFERDM